MQAFRLINYLCYSKTLYYRRHSSKKWKYLTGYFREEHAKVPRPKSGDEGGSWSWTSKWPHYVCMKFLLNQVTPQSPIGSLVQQMTNGGTGTKANSPLVIFDPQLNEGDNASFVFSDVIDSENLSTAFSAP